MEDYTRKDLIQLCEKAVVPHTKWNDRDSYTSQLGLVSIYKRLTAGLDFVIETETDEYTIWIKFNDSDLNKLMNGKDLTINSIEEYFRDCDPEHDSEMFNGEADDYDENYRTYMPTQKRLDEVKGEDWY